MAHGVLFWWSVLHDPVEIGSNSYAGGPSLLSADGMRQLTTRLVFLERPFTFPRQETIW